MGKIEDIERQMQAFSSDELAQFHAWFLEFDWAVWDHQIERDVQAGRRDTLAEKACGTTQPGKPRRLAARTSRTQPTRASRKTRVTCLSISRRLGASGLLGLVGSIVHWPSRP